MPKMYDFLKVKNQTDTKADLFIYGEIVSSEWDRWELEDVTPQGVQEYLNEIDGKDLNIYINSGGGSVFAGLAIYNMLKRHKGHKTVHVDGVAASISSVIALAGDKVVIPKNAFLMIHKPWAFTSGNSNDMRKMANDLDRIEEGILNVYKDHLKEDVELSTIKTMVTKETWLTGEQAAEYFNIETGEALEAVALQDTRVNTYRNTPQELLETKNEDETPSSSDTQKQEINDLLLQIDLL